MKTKAIALLILFVSFISAPTVLSKIYDDIDVSMAFVMVEEEEENHSGYEVKLEITPHPIESMVLYVPKLHRIMWKYSLKHDNASSEIFSPPPEFFLV